MVKSSSNTCYLYVIESASTGSPLKIGISSNPESRLSELQTGNPYHMTIKVRQEFATRRDARKAEADLHTQCNQYRLQGEWFQKQAIALIRKYLLKHQTMKIPRYSGRARMTNAQVQAFLRGDMSTTRISDTRPATEQRPRTLYPQATNHSGPRRMSNDEAQLYLRHKRRL